MEKWWVETWKRRPKIQLNHEKSASASPGRPRRSYPGGIDAFPHLGFRLGMGTKCTVWSCLLLLVRYRQRPTRIVSALVFRKKFRCFSIPAICSFVCIDFGRTFACFHYWFSAEKVCLWAVPLFKRNEKKRKLKQPLYNLKFISDLH